MADYIYLLENRLSPAQRFALRTVRELARSRNLTVFLVGGAVRDLTSGSPVRDLDVVVQGSAPKLRKDLESSATITGEIDAAQTLFATFPGGVRMEIGSTLAISYPRPGKPVYKPATILDDLRRRDFTANAMALSLNEGSYGLLMDPLNGVADIENRELRLASNYGFIEDPARLIRAARLMARLGWDMDEKTRQRYETGREENYISALSELQRGYELEEIVHEEDPLRVLRRLEADGWMQALAPFWTPAKVDVHGLEHLREVQTQLQMQGIQPEASAANFPLLTAKLSPKEVDSLKSSFVRQGFVKEIDSLEARARELTTQLNAKASLVPSHAWKVLTSAPAEAVLWVAYSSKSPAIQGKFKSFSTTWPQARQKMPYVLMQEMRIVPELPGYDDLLEKLFFELMDDKLQTPEEMKAFLEPYSPPAPPPPPSMRRPRAPRKDSKAAKSRARKAAVAHDADSDDEPSDVSPEIDDDLTGAVGTVDTPAMDDDLAVDAEEESGHQPDDTEDEEEDEDEEDTRPSSPARAPSRPAAKAPSQPPAKASSRTSSESRTAPLVDPSPAPAKEAEVGSAKATVSSPATPAPAKAASAPTARPSAKKSVPLTPSRPAVKTEAPAKAAAPSQPAKKAAPAPAKAASAVNKPVKSAPVKAHPDKKASAKAPAQNTPPAKAASKKAVPAKSSPKPAPAKSAPAKSAPAKSAPAKSALAKQVPAKLAPGKSVPAKSAPAKSVAAKSVAAKKSR